MRLSSISLGNLFLLFVTNVLVLLPIMSSKLPFSALFPIFNAKQKSLEKANILNNDRILRAMEYFSRLNSEMSKHFYYNPKNAALDLLVVIITVQRKRKDAQKLGYLLQTAASMDHVLKLDRNFKKKKLIICNVDSLPNHHTDAMYVSSFVPLIQRYFHNSSDPTVKPQRQPLYDKQTHKTLYEKETIDYMFCLEKAYLHNSTYILLMEDDVLPYSNFLDVVKYTLDQKLNMHHRYYAFLKLYYPQKWQGFAFETERVVELCCIGCVGAGIFVLIDYLRNLRRRTKQRALVSYFCFVSGAVYFILLASIIGRQNVMDLRRLSTPFFTVRRSPGCCTQAMLYTRHYIPLLLEHLEETIKHAEDHTDIAIYKFISKHNVPAFQIEPNLFQHIGMFSSLVENSYKNPEEFLFKSYLSEME